MSPLTTHALDTSYGKPAADLEVSLYRVNDDGTQVTLAVKKCNEDGRVKDLIENTSQWAVGTYRIRFETGRYFQNQGKETFYPYCEITFLVSSLTAHYHVPLLISPFGYSTYRGS